MVVCFYKRPQYLTRAQLFVAEEMFDKFSYRVCDFLAVDRHGAYASRWRLTTEAPASLDAWIL